MRRSPGLYSLREMAPGNLLQTSFRMPEKSGMAASSSGVRGAPPRSAGTMTSLAMHEESSRIVFQYGMVGWKVACRETGCDMAQALSLPRLTLSKQVWHPQALHCDALRALR